MSLSQQSIGALLDLIENKLTSMTVSDRDDLREKVNLQRALCELSALGGMSSRDSISMDVPRRGRRRRMQENYA